MGKSNDYFGQHTLGQAFVIFLLRVQTRDYTRVFLFSGYQTII